MAPGWPFEEFRDYLRALMDAQGIADYAELSRLSGVGQWQFSQWRRGLAQPSAKSLRRLAPTLKVAPVRLYLAAGVNDAAELDLPAQPDLTVLPAVLRDLVEMWPHLSDDQRSFAERNVALLRDGLRAELDRERDQPSRRRRPA